MTVAELLFNCEASPTSQRALGSKLALESQSACWTNELHGAWTATVSRAMDESAGAATSSRSSCLDQRRHASSDCGEQTRLNAHIIPVNAMRLLCEITNVTTPNNKAKGISILIPRILEGSRP